MAKWKVMKSIHQFLEHENDRKEFLEGSVFVTTSKREAFLHFAMHIHHAEVLSDYQYYFNHGEMIFKYKSPSGFHVHHIELLRNGIIYADMTDQELKLLYKFRQER